jgi:hypothetical protein
MSELGQSRHFGRQPTTSGPPLETDIVRADRHVSKVPIGDVSTGAIQKERDRQLAAASLTFYLPPVLRSAARSPQRDPSLALSDEVSQGPATAVAIGATVESTKANKTIRVIPIPFVMKRPTLHGTGK